MLILWLLHLHYFDAVSSFNNLIFSHRAWSLHSCKTVCSAQDTKHYNKVLSWLAPVNRKGWGRIDRAWRHRESTSKSCSPLKHVPLTAVAERSLSQTSLEKNNNSSTCAWAKNPPRTLAVIYEVLTPGPERISILLGKCFPLGSFSATVCRCLGDTERKHIPIAEPMKKACQKKLFSAELWQWSMTSLCLLTVSPSPTSGLRFGCQRFYTGSVKPKAVFFFPPHNIYFLFVWVGRTWLESNSRCVGSAAAK